MACWRVVLCSIGQVVQDVALIESLKVPTWQGVHSLLIEFLKYPLSHTELSNVEENDQIMYITL